MKNVHKKGGSEPESPSGVKRGRPPGTKNFDETKVTHGAGICPHCEKVRFKIEFFLIVYSVVSIKRTGSLNYFEVFAPLKLPV